MVELHSAINPSACLNSSHIQELIRSWLREDLPSFDFSLACLSSTNLNVNSVGQNGTDNPASCNSGFGGFFSFVILCKQRGVIAGQPFLNCLFRELGCTVTWNIEEGTYVSVVPQRVATVHGPASNLLKVERLALNIISRASGIASTARRLCERCDRAKWRGTLCGTRKTTPGFRVVEKYAMLVGGAATHRYDLSSMVMLKDNHLRLGYSMKEMIQASRVAAGPFLKIEVECCNKEEALEAAKLGADLIMIDNAEPAIVKDIAKQVKSAKPEVIIEVSGGVTEANIHLFFSEHVDIISTSRLCQGYETIDFSMKVLHADKSVDQVNHASSSNKRLCQLEPSTPQCSQSKAARVEEPVSSKQEIGEDPPLTISSAVSVSVSKSSTTPISSSVSVITSSSSAAMSSTTSQSSSSVVNSMSSAQTPTTTITTSSGSATVNKAPVKITKPSPEPRKQYSMSATNNRNFGRPLQGVSSGPPRQQLMVSPSGGVIINPGNSSLLSMHGKVVQRSGPPQAVSLLGTISRGFPQNLVRSSGPTPMSRMQMVPQNIMLPPQVRPPSGPWSCRFCGTSNPPSNGVYCRNCRRPR